MKKFIIFAVLAIVLCVPAFAVDENYFCANTITSYYSYAESSAVATGADVYFCYIDYGSSSSRATLVGLTFTPGASVNITRSGTTSTATISDSNSNTIDGLTVYYATLNAEFDSANSTPSVHEYSLSSGWSTICSDFVLWYNDYATPVVPATSSSFTVPCGNVLYFQVSSEQDVTLSAQMPQLSYLVQFGGNTYGPWGDTGIEYGPAASLPSSGTTFPILSMDTIQWAKGEPRNILGQTKVGVATKHCIVGQWYALFCPLTSPQVLDASTGDHAMGASVVVSGSFSQIKVYPLSETLDYDNPLGATYESGSNDDYGSYFDGSSDENGTVTWTNQDGQVQAPQSGGTNYVSPAANAESLLSQIRQLLANIVSELKSLFTFGYEAVQDLVGIMRDFVNVLGGLYTWLPAEVYSALMSAVVVAIVIGVFKVFL